MIDHNRAIVFGGWSGYHGLNDTYVLDMERWVWKLICLYSLILLLRTILYGCLGLASSKYSWFLFPCNTKPVTIVTAKPCN